jgi:hypothetical protein
LRESRRDDMCTIGIAAKGVQRKMKVPEDTAIDWRNRSTITVPEYAKIMRVGRNTAYEAVRVGEVATIKLRGRLLVPVPWILRQLNGET